ncbi:MAG: TadE/TadG family type IV pilus assembly protein [Fuerstiella sp.]
MYRRRKQSPARRGSACIEAAVTLPLLLTLVFGSIEASNAIFMKQSLTIAAYESAKVLTKSGGTSSDGETRCREILASSNVPEFTFQTDPAIVDKTTARGQKVTVLVTIPAAAGSLGPLWIYRNKTLTRSVSMVRL